MRAFCTYKRWRLKEGKQEAELVDLVRNEIVPHYRTLEERVPLGLLRIAGTRSYLAIQQWQSRALWEATRSSSFFESWWEAYQPILERWDELMEFEEEWETEDVLG